MTSLEKAKRLQEKLSHYIELQEALRELESDPELRSLLGEQASDSEGKNRKNLAANSKRGTIRNLCRELGPAKFTRDQIWESAQRLVPGFVHEHKLTRDNVTVGLDNLYRSGDIVRVKEGMRGSHGWPAEYGNPTHWKNGQLDKETK